MILGDTLYRRWQKTNTVQAIFKLQQDRDRAVDALLLLAYDSVISLSRAAELLTMSFEDIKQEIDKIRDE